MQYRLQKKKYKSFVLSCIIHGSMLMTLMYYTMYQVSRKDLAEPLKELMPAPVTIQPRQRRVLPFESTQKDEELTDNPVIPYGEQLDQFNTLEAPYQEVAEPNEVQQESYDQEELEQQAPVVQQHTPHGTFPSSTVSTKEFMQAFKEALRQEQPPEASHDPQTLVQQRLGRQWGQASYTNRIAQALNRSFRTHARSIKHNAHVNRRIVLALGILKDGTAEDLGNQPLSGIPEVDQHLRYVVQQAHFPPIPDRFQTDIYHLKISIQILLRDGALMFGKGYEVREG